MCARDNSLMSIQIHWSLRANFSSDWCAKEMYSKIMELGSVPKKVSNFDKQVD